MTWDTPTADKCPECGKTLFKRRGGIILCLDEKCGYETKAERKSRKNALSEQGDDAPDAAKKTAEKKTAAKSTAKTASKTAAKKTTAKKPAAKTETKTAAKKTASKSTAKKPAGKKAADKGNEA